jgi:hypothetical protein
MNPFIINITNKLSLEFVNYKLLFYSNITMNQFELLSNKKKIKSKIQNDENKEVIHQMLQLITKDNFQFDNNDIDDTISSFLLSTIQLIKYVQKNKIEQNEAKKISTSIVNDTITSASTIDDDLKLLTFNEKKPNNLDKYVKVVKI